MTEDNYIDIDVNLVRFTRSAVYVKTDDMESPTWIPRSCLHASTDLSISPDTVGCIMEIRVREWAAKELGLI